MQKTFAILLWSLIYLLPASVASASGLESLSFLPGCWQKTEGGKTRTENWSRRSSQWFQGRGVETKGKDIVFWEELEIQVVGGKILYTPSPMGQRSVQFDYQDLSNGLSYKKAAFINLKHDFPQQIFYTVYAERPNVLVIDVRGVNPKGDALGFSYSLNKVSCQQ